MLLQLLYILQIKPVDKPTTLDQSFGLGINQLVGERDMKGVLDALHLKWQPSAVTRHIGQKLTVIGARTETRLTHTALFETPVGSTLIDIGRGEQGLDDIHLTTANSI